MYIYLKIFISLQSTDKIQKDPSWRCQEKEVLVEGALRHKNVMFSIGDPSVSDVQRYELWEEIAGMLLDKEFDGWMDMN